MTKTLIFDTGSIISITSNNLLWTLKPLKKKFIGRFCITRSAKQELIDKPLSIKRFSFEALQTQAVINEETLSIVEGEDIYKLAEKILYLANHLVYAHNKPIHLVSDADVEGIAAAIRLKAAAYVIDERTVRLLVEDINQIPKFMSEKLHTYIRLDTHNAESLSKIIKGIPILRSFELMIVAYKMGLLDHLIPSGKNGRLTLLDAVLWGMKTDGCSVTEKEIRQASKTEQ